MSTLKFLIFFLINNLWPSNMIVDFVSYILADVLGIKFVGYLGKNHLISLMFEFHSFLKLLKLFISSILIK